MTNGDIRVLVVDDNADAADCLGLILEVSGYDVTVLYDSREALRVIDQLRPQVSVFDIGMPYVSGYQLASRVREASFPVKAVVAMSGWGTEGDKAHAARAGFDRHFTKPADPSQFLAYIHAQCAAPFND